MSRVEAIEPTPPTRRWLWPVLIVVTLGVLALASRDRGADTPDAVVPVADVESTCEKSIVYFVEGTARAVSITISNAQGNTEQAENRVVPLSSGGREGLRIGSMACGDFVYISAQNEGETGSVTCRIEADGVAIEEATSTGAYVIASCSGSVPA